jgi:hypothetical protein
MSSSKRLAVGALLAAWALAFGAARAGAAEDLAALQVSPLRGQSADQLRRDRYECHNWAIEQTGAAPLAAPVAHEAEQESDHAKRAERVQRVIAGAALGGALGGLIRSVQDKDPDNGVLAGAAVGAAIGAATGQAGRKSDEAEGPSDYLRALTACLQGRGYTVVLPGAPGGGNAASSARSSSTPAAGPDPGARVAANATVRY